MEANLTYLATTQDAFERRLSEVAGRHQKSTVIASPTPTISVPASTTPRASVSASVDREDVEEICSAIFRDMLRQQQQQQEQQQQQQQQQQHEKEGSDDKVNLDKIREMIREALSDSHHGHHDYYGQEEEEDVIYATANETKLLKEEVKRIEESVQELTAKAQLSTERKSNPILLNWKVVFIVLNTALRQYPRPAVA